MKTLLKLTTMELKLQFREPIALFFTLVFPVMLMILFGSIFGNEAEARLGGYGQVDLSVPGYIGMIIGTIGMLNIPVTLANYRDQGILRRLRATPLQSGYLLWAQVITQVVMSAAGILLLYLVGTSFYNLRMPTGFGNIIPAIAVSALSFFAVGFVLAGVMPTARAAQALGMAVLYPMLFLSGAAMPRYIMPDVVQKIGLALPLTHVVILIEEIWLKNSLNMISLVVVLGMLVVGLVVSRYTFRWE